MFWNILATYIYLSIGGFLTFAAWTNYFDVEPLFVWVGAAAFLIVGIWRLFHLSKS